MTAPAMRQQVNATVHLVYDADATLSAEQLRAAIREDVNRLLDADSESPVELCCATLWPIQEEAAIYSAEAPTAAPALPYTDYRCSKCGSREKCGHDATSAWDVVTQTAVLNGEFGDEWCNDCGEVNLVEFEITDAADIAEIDAARAVLRAQAEAPAMLAELRKVEADWGELFDSDEPMNGGDCCEYLCGLIETMRAILARIDA